MILIGFQTIPILSRSALTCLLKSYHIWWRLFTVKVVNFMQSIVKRLYSSFIKNVVLICCLLKLKLIRRTNVQESLNL